MELTWFKNGNEYRTLDGRWVIWGDTRRGFSLDDNERVHRSAPGAFDSVEDAKKQAERASRKSLPATETKAAGRFNIDDKVRTRDVSHVPARYRNAEGVVSNHRYRGERITVKFPDGGEHWFYENELTPVTSTKSLETGAYEAGRKANSEGVDYLNSPYSYRDRHLPAAAEWQRGWMDAEREKRSTKSLLRAKYKAVSDTTEFRPISNFRWNGQTWAHNGKVGTEIKTGKPTAQYNSVEVRGSRCWRNIDGVITSDD